MDWLRAKLILIVAFLILDAALAYHLRAPAHPQLEPSYLALPTEVQLRERLEAAGYRLAGSLPEPGKAVAELAVRPYPVADSVLEDLIPEAVRGGRRGDRSSTESGVLFSWDGHRAWVTREGWLIYSAPERPAAPGEFSARDAVAAADAWLNRHGVRPPGLFRLEETGYDPRLGAYRVVFGQRWVNGLPVLDARLDVAVAPDGVAGVEWRLWDAEAGPEARPVGVVPPAVILERELRPGGSLARQPAGLPEEGEGERSGAPQAVSVELGYRVDADARTARLVWRLTAGADVRIDFDAVSGARLEQVRP